MGIFHINLLKKVENKQKRRPEKVNLKKSGNDFKLEIILSRNLLDSIHRNVEQNIFTRMPRAAAEMAQSKSGTIEMIAPRTYMTKYFFVALCKCPCILESEF